MSALRRLVRTPFVVAYLMLLAILVLWILSPSTRDEAPQQNGLEYAVAEKALVVASLQHENTSWYYEELPSWRKYVYVVDDPMAELTITQNKGRESMAYLS